MRAPLRSVPTGRRCTLAVSRLVGAGRARSVGWAVVASAVALLTLPATVVSQAGPLVVVGGGGTPDDVVARALELAGGADAIVAVLPQASNRDDRGVGTVEMFRGAGAREAINARVEDLDAARAAVRRADLIWFPGGSQSRIMERLDGTGIVEMVRRRHGEGAVVGGTSAGAAVLSEVMLTGREYDLEAVSVGVTHTAPGLGLWPEVIVDQHFLARQRNNRLIAAVLDHPDLVGVGIDERTAVVVDDGGFLVMGEGTVLVYDPRDAEVRSGSVGERAAATGVRLHVLRAGMRWTVSAREAGSSG